LLVSPCGVKHEVESRRPEFLFVIIFFNIRGICLWRLKCVRCFPENCRSSI